MNRPIKKKQPKNPPAKQPRRYGQEGIFIGVAIVIVIIMFVFSTIAILNNCNC